MKTSTAVPATVDGYIAGLPPKARTAVQRVRRAIRKAAGGVEERISYQIPAFKLGGQYLVYVAAFKAHIGVYPAPRGDAAFQAAAAGYRSGKATLKFPLDQPVPLELITAVVRFRKLALLEAARKKAR
jgi:uncharacterized protein YdhG (YjbR/CyaY superfamily)